MRVAWVNLPWFNLLLGFITPDKGAIRIDGRPLADVPRQEWHRKVGYVQQEVFVLDGTLAEKHCFGMSVYR